MQRPESKKGAPGLGSGATPLYARSNKKVPGAADAEKNKRAGLGGGPGEQLQSKKCTPWSGARTVAEQKGNAPVTFSSEKAAEHHSNTGF